MTNAFVFDVPVELGLEFAPIVRSYLPDTDGKVSMTYSMNRMAFA